MLVSEVRIICGCERERECAKKEEEKQFLSSLP
jgi:hypothetical protein